MHLFYTNILILCLLPVLNPGVHLKKDGCMYRYGIAGFTCIGTSSLVREDVRHYSPLNSTASIVG